MSASSMFRKSAPAQISRAASGGRVNRGKPVSFTFDGRVLQGYEGDTLASALLANNIHLVGRSFKYHRPRGIIAAGSEEPNALVRVGRGAKAEPNLRATQVELYDGLYAESQNRFPSLKFDVGAVNSALQAFFPAGFYYKTFMWPASMWMTYEHVIRNAAGLGKVADDHDDPDRYEKTNAHCDVLVAGGGVAGLMAALQAGRSGARVILADEQNEFGGWLLGEADVSIDGKPAADWIAGAVADLSAMPEVTLLPRTTVFGYMDHNYLTLTERVTDHLGERPSHLPRQRMWKVRAGQTVLAQGAHERPLVFSGNDLPGVMLSGAVRSYINRYGVVPGNRTVVFTNNDDAYRTALSLHEAGANVVVVDLRRDLKGELVKAVRAAGIEIMSGSAVTIAAGTQRIARVEISPVNEGASAVLDDPIHMDCDLLAMSGGLSPAVHLHSQARGKLGWDERLLCFKPTTVHEASFSAGAGNGVFDAAKAMADGLRAGTAAATAAGFTTKAGDAPEVSAPAQSWRPLAAWKIANGQGEG